MISFVVYGISKPQGSKKSFLAQQKGGKPRAIVVDDNRRALRDWRADVSAVAQQHIPEGGLLDGAVVLRLRFYLQRPKSVSPKKRPYPNVLPDLDKLTRAIADALKGRIYTEDARITDLIVSKRYGSPPRVEIDVWELGDDEG